MASAMPQEINQQLKSVKVVGIIGCSQNKYSTSHHIASYLQEQGIQIIPINPNYEEVLGEKCYHNILDVPQEVVLDIVDIFRDSAYTEEMVGDIIKYAQKTNHKPLVWTQLDVSSKEAKLVAKKAGLQYVENKCIMVQHRNLQ